MTVELSPFLSVIVYAVGAASIAAWLDFRFPRFSPGDIKWILLHAAGAMVALQLTAAALDFAIGSRPGTIAAILGVGLPALVYAFLVGLWTVKLMSGAVRGLTR